MATLVSISWESKQRANRALRDFWSTQHVIIVVASRYVGSNLLHSNTNMPCVTNIPAVSPAAKLPLSFWLTRGQARLDVLELSHRCSWVHLSLRLPFLSSLIALLPLHSFQQPWAPVTIAFVLLRCSVSSRLRLASVYILGGTFISQAQQLSWNQSPIFGFAQMLYLALKVLLILTPSYLRTIPSTIPAKVQNSVTLH